METDQYLLSGIIFFVVSALSALVPAKKIRTTAYFLSLLGSLSFLFLGFNLIAAAPVSFPALAVSSFFEFALRGDALSGFFVITISLITFAISVYSIGFTRDMARRAIAVPEPLLIDAFIRKSKSTAQTRPAIVYGRVFARAGYTSTRNHWVQTETQRKRPLRLIRFPPRPLRLCG